MACLNCKQDKKIAGHGYCSACYCRLRRRGTLERKNVVNRGACIVAGCEKESFAKNLCPHHYQKAEHPAKAVWKQLRWRTAVADYPTHWDRFDAFIADVGERPSKFHQLRRIDAGLMWSKENCHWLCVVASKRDPMTPERRKAYAKEWNLQRRRNMSGEEYAAKMAAQNGCCAICSEPERAINAQTGRVQNLAVDHDHETGLNRGLLCVRCNKMIGYAQDDIATLMKAISYLRHHHSTKLKAIS